MTKRNLCCLVVYLFAVCCLFQQSRADDISAIKDRLISEAIPAWQDLAKKTNNLTFTIYGSRDDIKETKGRNYAYHTTKLSIVGTSVLECVYLDNEDGTVMENFSCKNKKYCFEIDRIKRDDAWYLNDISLKNSAKYDGRTFSSYQIISTAWAIFDISMIDAVKDSTFEINSVSSAKNTDNDELVTITFTLTNNKSVEKIIKQLKTGIVTFNTTKNWIIVSYNLSSHDTTYNYDYQGICDNVYDFSRDTPYLKSQKYTLVREKAKIPRITWTVDVQNVEPCTMKEKDFTLSAFGLQEPQELQTPFRVKVIQYVLVLVGLLLIIFGLSVKFWLKKNSKE